MPRAAGSSRRAALVRCRECVRQPRHAPLQSRAARAAATPDTSKSMRVPRRQRMACAHPGSTSLLVHVHYPVRSVQPGPTACASCCARDFHVGRSTCWLSRSATSARCEAECSALWSCVRAISTARSSSVIMALRMPSTSVTRSSSRRRRSESPKVRSRSSAAARTSSSLRPNLCHRAVSASDAATAWPGMHEIRAVKG